MDLYQKSPEFFVFVGLRLTEMMNASFCLFWSAKKVQHKKLQKSLSWGGYFSFKIQVIKILKGKVSFLLKDAGKRVYHPWTFFGGVRVKWRMFIFHPQIFKTTLHSCCWGWGKTWTIVIRDVWWYREWWCLQDICIYELCCQQILLKVSRKKSCNQPANSKLSFQQILLELTWSISGFESNKFLPWQDGCIDSLNKNLLNMRFFTNKNWRFNWFPSFPIPFCQIT